jgi:uncharacterized DUF497 family protein
MQFEWDPGKAAANLAKHQVSFEEPISVFEDPLATTVPDVEHSFDEERFLTTGVTSQQRIVIVWHTDREDAVRIIGLARRQTGSDKIMSLDNRTDPEPDEMQPEYDIRGGVRGKYYDRYRAGTNIVLLEPDVAKVFHDSDSVNRALRALIEVARAEATSS